MNAVCAAVLAAALGTPVALAQERLYVMTGNIFPQIQEINPANGSVISTVPVTGHESLFGGLAVDAGGTFWSIDGYNDPNPDRLFKIDRQSGNGGVVGPTGENWNFRTLYVNPVDDTLYAARDNALYKMDINTGTAHLIADITSPLELDQVTALAINAQGQAFITDIQDVSLFSLDLATGVATFIGNIRPGAPGPEWFEDLAFNSAGVLYGAHFNGGGMYTVNTTNATEQFIFPSSATGVAFFDEGGGCYPDCNGDQVLNLADFGCFQTRFALGDMYADCNGDLVLNLADFGCFQTSFALGCP